MYWEALTFELPVLPDGMHWHVFMNTSVLAPLDVWEPGQEPVLANQSQFLAGGRSVFILISYPDSSGEVV
jgi:glycogen operon protein